MDSSNTINSKKFAVEYLLRQTNIELLRIVAMILIIAHHLSMKSGFVFLTENITINRLWIQFIQIGGKIGVDVFILISGYFFITVSERKTNKLLKLWLQIFTYSILSFAIFTALGIETFSIKGLIRHLCPITFEMWWFASTYFILYLIFPYLNKVVGMLDKKQYQKMLILLTVIWSAIPTLSGQTLQRNDLLLFVFLYFLGGYVRVYGIKVNFPGGGYIALSSVLTVLTFFSAVVFDLLGTKIEIFGMHATFFYDAEKFPIILISFFMFLGFCKMKLKYNRIINVISSATFGVYLIHDNGYVSQFLWKIAFKSINFSKSNFLIPYTIIAIMLVFIACTAVELCRIYIIERRYFKYINRLAAYLDGVIEHFFNHEFWNKI